MVHLHEDVNLVLKCDFIFFIHLSFRNDLNGHSLLRVSFFTLANGCKGPLADDAFDLVVLLDIRLVREILLDHN